MALSSRSAGIVLNVCGQVMQNLAALLMSHGQQGQSGGKKHQVWFVGVALLALGALAVFASYGAAEQSLLASLISVQFVSNVAFGRVLFGKEVTPPVYKGTAVIVCGTLLCILNTPHVERELGEEDIWRLLVDNPPFRGFLLCEAMVWLLIDRTYAMYSAAERRGEEPRGSGMLLPSTFVARAALPGSYSIVAAKTLATLIRLSASGKFRLGGILLWLSFALWLGGTVFWLSMMNLALARFDSGFVIPLCQVNWSFFTIVSGGFFFREFENFNFLQLLLFVLGACANFSGAMMLRPGVTAKPEGEDLEVELLIS